MAACSTAPVVLDAPELTLATGNHQFHRLTGGGPGAASAKAKKAKRRAVRRHH